MAQNHVLHIITTIDLGGAEKQLLLLVKEQKRLGLKVSVLYLKGKADLKEDLLPFCSRIISLKSLCRRSNFRYIFNALNEGVVVHAHLPRAELLAFFMVYFRKNRLIISRHNTEAFFPRFPGLLSNFLSRCVMTRADRLIAISNAVQSFILKKGEVTAGQAEKVVVLHYGVDESSIQTRVESSFDFRIGSIARLVPQKNLVTLLRAFSRLRKLDSSKWSLHIAGEGPQREELIKLSKELGISENVIWHGKVSNVSKLLSEFDIFVLPSIYEGFGLVLLEAMTHGVPILATSTSSIPEVLGMEYPGLFSVGDSDSLFKLLASCKSYEFRSKLTDEYNERIGLFDISEKAEELNRFYFN